MTTTAATIKRTPSPTVYLTRGLPGSGRTTLAKQLAGRTGLVICPEDDLPQNLRAGAFTASHNGRCAVMALTELKKQLLAARPTDIVVERPHVQLWEMRAAVRLAQKHNYRVKVCRTTTPWAQSWQQCAARSRHEVPPHLMARMAAKFEDGVSPEKILRSLDPWERRVAAKKMWQRLEFLPLPEKRKAWRILRTKFGEELAILMQKHGLLQEHGWPNTAGEIDYLVPAND